jgi:hypothetical protein
MSCGTSFEYYLGLPDDKSSRRADNNTKPNTRKENSSELLLPEPTSCSNSDLHKLKIRKQEEIGETYELESNNLSSRKVNDVKYFYVKF